MSESSPSDLAVAFRSFARRLQEALGTLDPATRPRAAGHERAVAEALAQAATAVGVPSTGETARVTAGIADAIDATHPDAWDDAKLGTLRRQALAIGASIRAIADLGD